MEAEEQLRYMVGGRVWFLNKDLVYLYILDKLSSDSKSALAMDMHFVLKERLSMGKF